MPGTDAKETRNGDFEYIDYHFFEGVDYERKMSWKQRKGPYGRVAIGNPKSTNQKTDVDKNDVILPANWSVIVDKMDFKLVQS
ncbi:hypothetical protein BS50DRAFT_569269 [Corynespora cassiicola Philippines]|uniref:Uncharacterized protein n=1 Tax=Corynespora cassiicola Philippines TaxID=1448308 RepID=A0A2T2P823_CORCC|nr:hypothetical protein BS50DRAFT_569269 [Corynespora cassiicola Philippines]